MLRRTFLISSLLLGFTSFAQAEPAKMLVPAGAGGGYDTTGRLAMKILDTSGIYKEGVVVTNKPGAGGTLGLGEFIRNFKGQENSLMPMGVILVGSAIVTKGSPAILETTPLARLTFEYTGLAVPSNSPIKNVADLVAAIKANPGAVPFGGGSAGGVDHIIAGLIAKAAGVDPARLNYVPYASGAEAVTQLAGGKLAVMIQGASEVKGLHDAGRVRMIAVSSAERLAGIDVPTLKEQNVDVAMGNWRGVMGPPDMPEAARKAWVERFEKLSKLPEWNAELTKNGLQNAFIGGDDYKKFIESENARIRPVLTEMGLVK